MANAATSVTLVTVSETPACLPREEKFSLTFVCKGLFIKKKNFMFTCIFQVSSLTSELPQSSGPPLAPVYPSPWQNESGKSISPMLEKLISWQSFNLYSSNGKYTPEEGQPTSLPESTCDIRELFQNISLECEGLSGLNFFGIICQHLDR